MRYPIVERFAAVQGEGLWTGCPMKFVRLVGCSVGQKICTACDTHFEKPYPEMGGGIYDETELVEWAGSYRHACLTGGEPMDRDLTPLIWALTLKHVLCHVETSGTRLPKWLSLDRPKPYEHRILYGDEMTPISLWIAVSPKPGWMHSMIDVADEVKVIVGGLGDGPGWPTIEDACKWASVGKLVYVQPRNSEHTIDQKAMDEAIAIVDKHPTLRLSAQLHKYINVR
jgi:7-carboxy-7-deazaguanine synthase